MTKKTTNETLKVAGADFSVPARPARSILLMTLLLGVALFALSGCVTAEGGSIQLPISQTPSAANYDGVIQSVALYNTGPTPTPDPAATEEAEGEEDVTVVVSTGGSRANVRSAPSLSGAIIAKADNGDVLQVLGQSEDGAWWQVTGMADPSASADEGWISDSVVTLGGEDALVPVVVDPSAEPLFGSDLAATWDIDWTCESEEGRCTVDECTATVTAGVTRDGDGEFLPVEYNVAWDDSCFDTDSWVFEVNPFTGQERSGEYTDNFLYSYWTAANSADISGVYPITDDSGIVVLCKGPETVEVEEGNGWTTVYEGNICHDQSTGMLVYMNYTKRWLYTGEFEGENYDRAFFGDVEHLEQRLADTNAIVAEVPKR